MAYPAIPDHRIAYDVDGTVVLKQDEGDVNPYELTQGQKATWNNEDDDSYSLSPQNPIGGGWCYAAWFWPEPMLITGYHFNFGDFGDISASDISYSNDATAMFDGTWTSVLDPVTFVSSAAAAHYSREHINGISVPSHTALRLYYYNSRYRQAYDRSIHWYGRPVSLGTTQRLVLWDETLDQRIDKDTLDWGDAYRGNIYTRNFRVKNLHDTLTAQTVNIGTNALTVADPPLTNQTEFSIDGGAYSTSLVIGDLAPGAISNVITVRLTVAADAQAGPWWVRYDPVASGWV